MNRRFMHPGRTAASILASARNNNSNAEALQAKIDELIKENELLKEKEVAYDSVGDILQKLSAAETQIKEYVEKLAATEAALEGSGKTIKEAYAEISRLKNENDELNAALSKKEKEQAGKEIIDSVLGGKVDGVVEDVQNRLGKAEAASEGGEEKQEDAQPGNKKGGRKPKD